MHDATLINSRIWRKLYAAKRNDLRYPNDVLVRIASRLVNAKVDRRILDFGCGTGANLLHFAALGFEMSGVDISEDALARARERLDAANVTAELHLIGPEERLPHEDGRFDMAYSWQVLYYCDPDGWRAKLREFDRVCKRGALVLIATAASGDVSQLRARRIGENTYRSEVEGQNGCILTIPDRQALPEFFPGRSIEVGEFGFTFGSVVSRHWIVSYRTPTHE